MHTATAQKTGKKHSPRKNEDGKEKHGYDQSPYKVERDTKEQYLKTKGGNKEGDGAEEGQKIPVQHNQNQDLNKKEEEELEKMLTELEKGMTVEYNSPRAAEMAKIEENTISEINAIEEDYETIIRELCEINDEKGESEEKDETHDEES